jgi:hypothetical protein
MQWLRVLTVAPMLAAVSLLVSFAAQPLAAGAQSDAYVRVAALSPDAPAVDVYVNGTKLVSAAAYKSVSDYLPVAVGSDQFKVTDVGSTKALINVSETVNTDEYYTFGVLGPLSKIMGEIFQDDLGAPPSGDAKIRAIHAAVAAPSPANILAGGKPVFPGLAFEAATQFAAVPAGSYTFGVAPMNSNTAAFSATATLVSGDVYTAFGIGNGASAAYGLLLVNDSAGASMSGGPGTGEGGLSIPNHGTSPFVPAALAGVLLLAAGGLGLTQLRARAR